MSEQQHTPGPWEILLSEDLYAAVVAPGRTVICVDIENEADARLIAAAPDLLQALQNMLVMWLPGIHASIRRSVFEEAQAAVDKAKGIKE